MISMPAMIVPFERLSPHNKKKFNIYQGFEATV